MQVQQILLIYGSFSESVNSTTIQHKTVLLLLNNPLQTVLNQAVMAWYEAQCLVLPGGTDTNLRTPVRLAVLQHPLTGKQEGYLFSHNDKLNNTACLISLTFIRKENFI